VETEDGLYSAQLLHTVAAQRSRALLLLQPYGLRWWVGCCAPLNTAGEGLLHCACCCPLLCARKNVARCCFCCGRATRTCPLLALCFMSRGFLWLLPFWLLPFASLCCAAPLRLPRGCWSVAVRSRVALLEPCLNAALQCRDDELQGTRKTREAKNLVSTAISMHATLVLSAIVPLQNPIEECTIPALHPLVGSREFLKANTASNTSNTSIITQGCKNKRQVHKSCTNQLGSASCSNVKRFSKTKEAMAYAHGLLLRGKGRGIKNKRSIENLQNVCR